MMRNRRCFKRKTRLVSVGCFSSNTRAEHAVPPVASPHKWLDHVFHKRGIRRSRREESCAPVRALWNKPDLCHDTPAPSLSARRLSTRLAGEIDASGSVSASTWPCLHAEELFGRGTSTVVRRTLVRLTPQIRAAVCHAGTDVPQRRR
jgi:hypothetical protein